MVIEPILEFVAALILFLAVLTDFRKSKIPNILLIVLLPFQLYFYFLSVFYFHKQEIVFSDILYHFLEVIILFLFLYTIYSFQALGAGDVKLIIVTAIGVKDPFMFVLFSFGVGAVESIAVLLGARKKHNQKIHFALPIFLGFLLYTAFSFGGKQI